MPLPERYAKEIPEMTEIWTPRGYFLAQGKIWDAESEARHELYKKPSGEQLDFIRKALVLTPEELEYLVNAKGHETNRFLRLIQEKLQKQTGSSEAGNFIHLGNTSSDVLDTSTSLQMIESLDIVGDDFKGLKEALNERADQFDKTIQMARTHTQNAIPHTFGRQMLGWYAEAERGEERINKAKKIMSVGKLSGEVGTNVFISPELEELSLSKLGLKPDEAPSQVISRDRHAEVLCLMAVNGGTLARIATNIRLLAMTEVGEVREPFEAGSQQGSSAMPHKRNTELSERINGLARIIRAAAMAELESQELWLDRDISHSSTERFTFPDAFGCLDYMTRLTKKIIEEMVVFPDKMAANVDQTYGAIYSARLLNHLLETDKISRTDAYDLVKKMAQQAMDKKKKLYNLASRNNVITSLVDETTLKDLFLPTFYLKNIGVARKRLGLPPVEKK
jgi:adenylosuccinate lyase